MLQLDTFYNIYVLLHCSHSWLCSSGQRATVQSCTAYRKTTVAKLPRFKSMSFKTAAWQQQMAECVRFKEELFPPGLTFKETLKELALWPFQRNGYTSSAGWWGFFPLKIFLKLWLFRFCRVSCRGVSWQSWQLHRIMTHASCACQMSLD